MSEAHRILKPQGTLVILDIDPTYTPSKSMLLGEPYIMGYRHNIDRQLAMLPGFSSVNRTVVIPGQVILWILTKS
jgi:ubiquinone/menaquinone biosynthesis C-methylase UbiE